MTEKIAELAKRLKDLGPVIEFDQKKLKEATDEYASIEQELITEMKNQNIVVGKIEGVGEVSLKSSAFYNFLAENKDKLFQKLRDMGEGALIETKEDVNKQTLRGWCNEMQKNGKTVPEEIYTYFKEVIKIK